MVFWLGIGLLPTYVCSFYKSSESLCLCVSSNETIDILLLQILRNVEYLHCVIKTKERKMEDMKKFGLHFRECVGVGREGEREREREREVFAEVPCSLEMVYQ